MIGKTKVICIKQRYFKLKEAVKYCSIALYTLRELIWKGELPFIQFGKNIYLDKKDIDKYMKKRKKINEIKKDYSKMSEALNNLNLTIAEMEKN